MPNSVRVATSVSTAVGITPSSGWFSDAALSQSVTFPVTVSATSVFYTASGGSCVVSAVAAGIEYGGQKFLGGGAAANVNVTPAANGPGGLSSLRPAASEHGRGFWFSVDTGSLDYSDGTTWTSGIVAAKGTLTDAAGQLTSILDKGVVSTAINVVGDSTGVSATRWPYLLGQYLGTAYPSYTVNIRNWNGTNFDFDAPVRLQTGAAGERYGRFDLSAQSYLSMPDSAANSITGDLDVRIKVACDVWSSGVEQELVAKFGGGGARSWRFYVDPTAHLTYDWTTDGTTLLGPKVATTWTPPANGAATWLRVTHKVNNAASGNDITFYSSTDGVAWTQLGTVVTTAGVTSIFDSTASLQVGARGDTSGPGAHLTGAIYEVQVRNGINGPVIAPTRPEWWPVQSSNSGGGAGKVPMVGAPVLDIVNGSQSGADITSYLNTNVAKMTPDYGTSLTFINCSHNDAYLSGAGYLAQWDALLAAMKARLPVSAFAVMLQNPRTTPAIQIDSHSFRLGQLQFWAAKNNAGWVDVYRAFVRDGRALPLVLVNADGIHPTDAAGSPLWAATIEAELRKRAS